MLMNLPWRYKVFPSLPAEMRKIYCFRSFALDSARESSSKMNIRKSQKIEQRWNTK